MSDAITKQELDELMRIKVEHEKRLADESARTKEAEYKANLEKIAADMLEKLQGAQKKQSKLIFSGEPKEGESKVSFQKFMQMVKFNHPELVKSKFEDVEGKTILDSTTAATAAYSVPIEYSDKIWGTLNNIAELPALFTEVPMTSRQQYAPQWLSSITGGYTTESTNGTTTNPTLARVTLTLAFYRAIISQSMEYEIFNNVQMDQKLIELFAEELGQAMESQALVGSGSPFTGITGTAGVPAVLGAGNLTYKDMLDLRMNKNIFKKYHKNARWALSFASMVQVMNLKDDSNRPLWNMNAPLSGIPSTILDKPYHITDQTGETSTGIIIYGDFSQILKGRLAGKPDLFVDYSKEAVDDASVNYWLANASGYRFNHLHALALADKYAFGKLTGFSI
jgi:HK97 family phage major capsid protein